MHPLAWTRGPPLDVQSGLRVSVGGPWKSFISKGLKNRLRLHGIAHSAKKAGNVVPDMVVADDREAATSAYHGKVGGERHTT